jgi:TPP-dependent pyruvate/acetoin dehydrogenase alpha subunit
VRQTDQVALCFFGDGAVNQGTFHESLNMASLWKLPVVYLCENNGYAITTSIVASHGQPSIAKRAESYGMVGVAVDGQDLSAVYEVTADAVARARLGSGPTLVEAKTYRFDEHEVGLVVPGKPYRSDQEVAENTAQRDPLVLFYKSLLGCGVAETMLKSIEDEVAAEIQGAVAFAESSPLPNPAGLYEYLYSNPLHRPAQTLFTSSEIP